MTRGAYDARAGLKRRLLWFVGLWLAGVATLAACAWLLRLAMTL